MRAGELQKVIKLKAGGDQSSPLGHNVRWVIAGEVLAVIVVSVEVCSGVGRWGKAVLQAWALGERTQAVPGIPHVHKKVAGAWVLAKGVPAAVGLHHNESLGR